MRNQLRFSLPGNKENVTTARLAVASYANTSGFSLEDVEDLSVAISEAWKVVCCHGHKELIGRFLVVCGMQGETLSITISESNSGFTIEKRDCIKCDNCPKDGDLSMFIISSLMDKAELKEDADGGRKLIMEKVRHRR